MIKNRILIAKGENMDVIYVFIWMAIILIVNIAACSFDDIFKENQISEEYLENSLELTVIKKNTKKKNRN